jgi:hypothetical protein
MHYSSALTPDWARHRMALMLRRMREQRWRTDDSLGRLSLDETEERLLVGSVRILLEEGIRRLAGIDRERWGAAMLLVGARALRRSGEGPFSYDLMGEVLGIEGLADKIGGPEREAMELGAGFWRIQLLRTRTEDGRPWRRFLGTMIRHSGGGWAILDRLASLVSRRWHWAGIRAAEAEAVAAWIEQCATCGHVGRGMAHALENDETRHALAERLQDLAAVWAMLQEAGATTVEHALQALGADALSSWLDAPDHASARRMLEHLCEASGEGAPDRIRWHWFSDGQGREGVTIALPERIRLPDVPEEADRIELRLLDVRPDRGCSYVRRGGVFEHRQGLRQLRTPVACFEQVVVIAQYRRGHESGELVAAELSLPAPVTVFDTRSGRALRWPRSGMRIALVPQPGWSLCAPPGFAESGRAPLRAWVGEMPAGAAECAVLSPEGEEEPWTLSPTPMQLDIALPNAITGLRLHRVPVVQGAPHIRIGLMRGRGTCTVHDEHGATLMEGVAVKSWGGRVELPMERWAPGIYRLTLAFDGRACSVRFAVLPADARVDVHGGQEGTNVRLIGADLTARLSLRDRSPALAGEGSLLLGPEIRGSVVIDVAVACGHATWIGAWSLHACPEVVEIVGAGGDRETRADLSLLRGGGGLRIHGRPRSTAVVEAGDLRWSVQLSPEGERLFPFTLLPSFIFQRNGKPLAITMRWPGGEKRRLVFSDPSASRPEVRVVPSAGDQTASRLCLAWKHDIVGEVHVEAVAAWRPWWPATRLPVVPARWDDKAGYETCFSLPPGGYQIALMSGDRRVSGMALVWSSEGRVIPPPDGLGPLERELWNEPSKGRLATLLEECMQARDEERIVPGLLRNLARYGAGWFRIADVLVNILGWRRLETLLYASMLREIDQLVDAYYDAVGVSWMFVRARDLDRTAITLAALEHGRANMLLRNVGEQYAGLLLPALRCWDGLLSREEPFVQHLSELKPLHDGYAPLQRLTHEELDCLRETDIDADMDEICGGVRASLRLRGLLELRGFREEIEAQPVIREIAAASRLEDKWFSHLPEQLQAFERAVASLAWEVHCWRQGGHMATKRMQEISRLELLARHSFDYWLNTWDRIATAAEGDAR